MFNVTKHEFQKDILQDNNQQNIPNAEKDQFAVTFDRGITKGGSSGSAFFNLSGKIVGHLHGGNPKECCADVGSLATASSDNSTFLIGDDCERISDENANVQKTYKNGNTERYSKYGRFWYSWDKVKYDENGDGIVTPEEEIKSSLKPWLDPFGESNGSMDGFDLADCIDLQMRDGTCDTGNEPNNNCNMGSWDDIWQSPDLWTCTDEFCTEESYQQPSPLIDNWIGYRVKNGGTCPSRGGVIRLYWTIASTGEMWPNHWQDDETPVILDGIPITCHLGQEIEASPIKLPDIAPQESYENRVRWNVPNYLVPDEQGYMPPFPCGLSVEEDPLDGQAKYEICLLARIENIDDPIVGEDDGSISNNVMASNNIVTRNTYLVEPIIDSPGEDNPVKPVCVLVANNNPTPQKLDVTLDGILVNDKEKDVLRNIDLILSPSLWQKWQSTGAKGTNVNIIDERVVRVTDRNSATLLNIPFEAGERLPLCTQVTQLSTPLSTVSSVNDEIAYSFGISHRAHDPNISINPSSTCTFLVKNNIHRFKTSSHGQLTVYPNPFQNQTTIRFHLKEEQKVNLELYDIKGQLVQTLVNDVSLSKGTHNITVDGKNLAEGLYIYTLKTTEGIETGKIVKVK